jgi:hypothetical protein
MTYTRCMTIHRDVYHEGNDGVSSHNAGLDGRVYMLVPRILVAASFLYTLLQCYLLFAATGVHTVSIKQSASEMNPASTLESYRARKRGQQE